MPSRRRETQLYFYFTFLAEFYYTVYSNVYVYRVNHMTEFDKAIFSWRRHIRPQYNGQLEVGITLQCP